MPPASKKTKDGDDPGMPDLCAKRHPKYVLRHPLQGLWAVFDSEGSISWTRSKDQGTPFAGRKEAVLAWRAALLLPGGNLLPKPPALDTGTVTMRAVAPLADLTSSVPIWFVSCSDGKWLAREKNGSLAMSAAHCQSSTYLDRELARGDAEYAFSHGISNGLPLVLIRACLRLDGNWEHAAGPPSQTPATALAEKIAIDAGLLLSPSQTRGSSPSV